MQISIYQAILETTEGWGQWLTDLREYEMKTGFEGRIILEIAILISLVYSLASWVADTKWKTLAGVAKCEQRQIVSPESSYKVKEFPLFVMWKVKGPFLWIRNKSKVSHLFRWDKLDRFC